MMKQVYGVDGLSWTPGSENEEERGVKRNRAREEFAPPDSQQIGRGSQAKGENNKLEWKVTGVMKTLPEI